MAGRAGDYDEGKQGWTKIHYMPTTAENGFSPALPEEHGGRHLPLLTQQPHRYGAECPGSSRPGWTTPTPTSPSSSLTAAYERFITEPGVPHSIFEIEGAKTCAIEFRSFSKTAGFTGARCGYTVVPTCSGAGRGHACAICGTAVRPPSSTVRPILSRRARRPSTPSRARRKLRPTSTTTSANAKVIMEGLKKLRSRAFTARSTAPYVWCKTPDGMGSWDFFDAAAGAGQCDHDPRCRLRPQRRGLYPAHRLRRCRGHQGSSGPHREAAEQIKEIHSLSVRKSE